MGKNYVLIAYYSFRLRWSAGCASNRGMITSSSEVYIKVLLRTTIALAALTIPAALFGQNPITADSPYQVNYASHLDLGDGVVNVTNSGASAGGNVPIANGNTFGYICANVYVYAPDQELAACCSCAVSPNSLHAWPISFGPGNLLSNVNNTTTLRSINETHSVVIKLVATAATNGTCARPDAPDGLATGMVAWATHSHPTNTSTVAITETPFVPATLSAGEAGKLTQDCGFLLTRGSGSVCPGCITGGLGVSIN